jgi:ribosomal protein S26
MEKCPKCKGDIKFGVCQNCDSDIPKEKPVKKPKKDD